MMTQLDRMTIKGFKSIREADIELRPLNVLIGANGSGKSNFISVFRLLNEIQARRLQVYTATVGAESLLYFGRKVTDGVLLQLFFGKDSYRIGLVPTDNDTLVFEVEDCLTENVVALYGGNAHPETRLHDALNDIKHWSGTISPTAVGETFAATILQILEGWKVYHFHDTSSTAAVKQPGNINDNERLRPDAANLAAYLYLLKERHQPYYENIVKTIRLAAPFFDDFNLRPDPLNPERIRLEWHEYGSDNYFNAHMLSDGTLRFICLATMLMQPESMLPTTILIDEPELGLHPFALTLLASLLRSASHHSQVIITTQSVSMVNHFSYEDLIVVDRRDKQSIFHRPNEEDVVHWLDDYSTGELWEKNIFGGRPQRVGA
jgi:predicted ATPase